MKKEFLYIGLIALIIVIGGCGTETTETTEETEQGVETTVEENAEATDVAEPTVEEAEETTADETEEASEESIEEIVETNEASIKEFTITAVRFGYTPNTITVQKGDTVKITINNADGMHGLKITELGISGDEEVTFVAETAGTFTWRCNNFCGSGHKEMSGTLIVEE